MVAFGKGTSPKDVGLLGAFVEEELRKVDASLNEIDNLTLEELHAEPVKPRTGMVVLADGTDWNPGAGGGYYGFFGIGWTPLSGAFSPFTTRNGIPSINIPAAIVIIKTSGYDSSGDEGHASYKRVGAEPSHNLKVQSNDGAWWELVPDSHGYINVRQAGAKGDDTTNDGQAFIDALSFASLNATSNDNATFGVIVPPSNTPYYLGANTLEFKRAVHLVGQGSGQAGGNACQMRWDANITGIIVHGAETIGAGKEALGGPGNLSASGSIIEGLLLRSDGGTIAGITDDTKGHAIWLRSRAVLLDLQIWDFPGNGINIVATAGSGDDARFGNANNWVINRARIIRCHKSGIFVDGADVNAGYCIGVDVTSNGRWGIHDSSFLGNTYIGCHADSNGLATMGENGSGESSFVHLGGRRYGANAGATEAQLVATTPGTDETVWYDMRAGGSSSKVPTWLASQPEGTYFHGGPYHSDNANARNIFTGNYVENGQGPSQWIRPTIVFGGFIGDNKGTALIFDDDTIVGKVIFPNHQRFAAARDLDLRINPSANKIISLQAEGDKSGGLNLLAWDETEGHFLIGEHGNLGARRPIRLTSDLATATYGRASAVTGCEVVFHQGIFLGVGTGARHMINGTAAPTSGEHGRGEIVWNRNLAVGSPIGWGCTVAGTPGTWVAMVNL